MVHKIDSCLQSQTGSFSTQRMRADLHAPLVRCLDDSIDFIFGHSENIAGECSSRSASRKYLDHFDTVFHQVTRSCTELGRSRTYVRRGLTHLRLPEARKSVGAAGNCNQHTTARNYTRRSYESFCASLLKRHVDAKRTPGANHSGESTVQ